MQRHTLRIHYLQHVPYEGTGCIEPWAMVRGHGLTATRLFAGEFLPPVEQFDWLIILGGPMNVDEDSRHPWLAREKRLIGEALHSGKTVVGIGLGARLMAYVLGARVMGNHCREIGWHPVEKTAQASESPLARHLPDRFAAFHWHGETFEIPRGAVHLARSRACENQAFAFGDRAVALEFHLEFTRESVEQLIENRREDLVEGPCIQGPEDMLGDLNFFRLINGWMDDFLDGLASSSRS